MTKQQMEAKLGLAEFALLNTRDEEQRIKLLNYINKLSIALGRY